MAWLLDTDILSELRRPSPEPRVVEFVASKPLEELYISVVTLAEIRFGIELVADAERRTKLSAWLASKVRPMFDGRVLPVSKDVMLRWRLLVEMGRKGGHILSARPDLLRPRRSSTGCRSVTRDRAEYERAGAVVLNPGKGLR